MHNPFHKEILLHYFVNTLNVNSSTLEVLPPLIFSYPSSTMFIAKATTQTEKPNSF